MRIARAWIIACCLSLAAASTACGNDADKTHKAPSSTSTQALTVDARAIEQPLMKYRLFPAEYELQKGNAAPILLRLPWEQIPYFTKEVPTFSTYLDLPLTDPKLRSADEVFSPGFYRVLKRAAFRRTADWEYPLGEEPAAAILLPDVQGARSIVGNGLSVWIRQHIARGQLDEAREAILVGLAVSRHYGRTPFLITQLVCANLDSMLLARLEELLSQPGCPNLYWAMTALPRPFIDLRPSIELEQKFLQMSLPGDLEQSRTEEQWTKLAGGLIELFSQSPLRKETGPQIVERLSQSARAALPAWIDGGAERVARMSNAEVFIRWSLHIQQEQSQESAALMSLDPPAALPRLAALQQRLAQFYAKLDTPVIWVVENTPRTYLVAHRFERRIDALRAVEAIRDYAAHHGQQLPASLAAIADTPVPDDLFTGNPFHYEVHEGRAILSAPGIQESGKLDNEIRYQITVRK